MEKLNSSFFILLFFLMTQNAQAQDLKKNQWENRLLLLISNNSQNENFRKQISELKANQEGLKERKLVVYQIFPKEYKMALNTQNELISSKLYSYHNPENSPFKVILIGLDGGVKLERPNFLSCKTLFGTIDSMPMRQNELRRKVH
ncbi:MAG: DUF4174 domain-containing protein [Flammeovirgaceae bacterium]|nr:DUF4174 domain-containing protein [Flammeovirgaceae bacterium]